MNPYENITDAISRFAHGETMHFEVPLAEGIWFDFDCPHESDLTEPVIPISVGIAHWSPHFGGVPDRHDLMDYNEVCDDIAADLEGAIRNIGATDTDVVLEYSPNNSDPDSVIHFLGAVGNPRVRFDASMNSGAGNLVVNEEYA